MPEIGETGGKTYAVGFWQSPSCDNSLAEFPITADFSWGNLIFTLDNLNEDNYVEIKMLDTSAKVLKTYKFTTKGRKTIDLSGISEIGSTQDIKLRFEITALEGNL